MAIRKTLVNYTQINRAIKNQEAVTQETQKHALAVAANPVEAGAMLTSFAAALDELERAERYPDVLTAPDHEVASLLQAYLAERVNEEGKLEPLGVGLEEAKFDELDLKGWIFSFFGWWRQLKKHAWLATPASADQMADTIRVGLLGDWGTGLYGAPVSAHTIENDKDGYGVLLHLGDVYYAGKPEEVQERFIDLWPKNKNAVSRAINSNHEMYTGGQGYFEKTLPLFKQSASCFALQNKHWTLVGLDSAYRNPHKGGLTDDQIVWLRAIVKAAGGRRVILFSHHQPFSSLETANNDLVEQVSELLNARKIFAWYWGHEHRCVIHARHPVWDLYGRCVGHSGFPYFIDDLKGLAADPELPNATWRRLPPKNLVPGGIVLNDRNPYVEGHADEYGAQGHMTLEFDGEHLREIVHFPNGERIYDRPLV